MVVDAPDYQRIITTVAATGAVTDAPDWQRVVVAPGGAPVGGGALALISSQVLTVETAPVTFTVPSGYNQLLLKFVAVSSGASGPTVPTDWVYMNLNGSSNLVYDTIGDVTLWGANPVNFELTAWAQAYIGVVGGSGGGRAGVGEVSFVGVSSSDFEPSWQSRSSVVDAYSGDTTAVAKTNLAGVGHTLSQITEISVGLAFGHFFEPGSAFYLYGVT